MANIDRMKAVETVHGGPPKGREFPEANSQDGKFGEPARLNSSKLLAKGAATDESFLGVLGDDMLNSASAVADGKKKFVYLAESNIFEANVFFDGDSDTDDQIETDDLHKVYPIREHPTETDRWVIDKNYANGGTPCAKIVEFVDAVTTNLGRVRFRFLDDRAQEIDQNVRLQYLRIPITATPDGSEQDTGVDLPAEAVVRNVYVDVTTAEATGSTTTLNVGLLSSESDGDADGFLAAVSVASTGLKRASLATGSVTRGALLLETETGGSEVPAELVVESGTARSVTYTAGSTTWAEFRGDIIIEYTTLSGNS